MGAVWKTPDTQVTTFNTTFNTTLLWILFSRYQIPFCVRVNLQIHFFPVYLEKPWVGGDPFLVCWWLGFATFMIVTGIISLILDTVMGVQGWNWTVMQRKQPFLWKVKLEFCIQKYICCFWIKQGCFSFFLMWRYIYCTFRAGCICNVSLGWKRQ